VSVTANILTGGLSEVVAGNFEPGLFGPMEVPPRKQPKSPTKSGAAKGSKAVLSWRKFLLPELIGQADNGDPSVRAISSSEQEQQTLHLLEMSSAICSSMNEGLERKRYLQWLKQDQSRASELAVFIQGGVDAEEKFVQWLQAKLSRKIRALQRKANRLAACAVIARPMDCAGCGLKGYVRFYCGCRYCRNCGHQVFLRLFAKYIRLREIVERLMCRDGFRPSAVLATFTFTTANLDRMPTPEEIRKFNQDVRATLRIVCGKLGVTAAQFGALWCDEFGGWNPKLHDYNTNLHCHGIWLGPFLPLKLVSAIWSQVRGNDDYRVVVESVPFYHDRPDFARALGHALKYTSKHVSSYSPERLAELEVAFGGVRRVHTMGLFYNAKETREDSEPSATPLCPRCGGQLVYPRNCALQLVKDLEREGRVDLDAERRRPTKKDIPEEVPS
jgi:hypothetical protein